MLRAIAVQASEEPRRRPSDRRILLRPMSPSSSPGMAMKKTGKLMSAQMAAQMAIFEVRVFLDCRVRLLSLVSASSAGLDDPPRKALPGLSVPPAPAARRFSSVG